MSAWRASRAGANNHRGFWIASRWQCATFRIRIFEHVAWFSCAMARSAEVTILIF